MLRPIKYLKIHINAIKCVRNFSLVNLAKANAPNSCVKHERHEEFPCQLRTYSQRPKNPPPPSVENATIDENTFEVVCDETLEALSDFFEEIVEADATLEDTDVMYGSGVLTVKLGGQKGTYVLNR